jgi:predicted dehydrogenase
MARKVRYAVVGLGHIAQVAVLPAFAHAANSELTALVSDDAAKLRKVGRKYGVRNLFSYDQYEACLRSGQVDAVYIALPNSLHRDYTERAARAGVHVLCEKPLAVTAQDAQAMVRAAERSGIRLMTAYRLHFEAANLRAVEIVRSGRLGEPRLFDSVFTMNVKEGNIRLRKELGGGPLYDIGIYCINAARYLFRDEPYEVLAASVKGAERRFREVDEATSVVMRFPKDRLASFTCSFGAADVSSYRVVGTKGDLVVEPAYEYAGSLAHRLTVGGRASQRTFARRDQFAPELLHFSDCILRRRTPHPDGREGLADVRIIEALLRSARSGRPVRLTPVKVSRRPTLADEKRRPAVRKPEVVRAESASGD